MASRALLKTDSLTPSQFASAIKLSLLSELEIKVEKLALLRFEQYGIYSGFSAFFLSLIASSKEQIKELLALKQEDKISSKVFKKHFFKTIALPVIETLEDQKMFFTSRSVKQADVMPIFSLLSDQERRCKELTQKTLEKVKSPKKLALARCPFTFMELEVQGRTKDQEALRVAHLEDLLREANIREPVNALDQPRGYEYLTNFLRQCGYSLESLPSYIDVVVLKKGDIPPIEEASKLFMEPTPLSEVIEKSKASNKLADLLVFTREPTWDPLESSSYFFNTKLVVENAKGQKALYRIKAITFKISAPNMPYSCRFFEENDCFEWSFLNSKIRHYPAFFDEIKACEKELLESKRISKIGRITMMSLVELVDTCFYERIL